MGDKELLCPCGKKRYEWQTLCWKCEQEKDIKEIWAYAEKNKEVTNEKYVILWLIAINECCRL